jgi:hypothetical protein
MTTQPSKSELASRDIRAARYVASIRSNPKRAYAHRFLTYLRNGVADDIGAQPGDPGTRETLPYMAAQAVEMRLREIWRGEN